MPDVLRIAQVAPIARAVSLASPSAIEQLVALLCDELVRRGHAVTLFASGDSATRASLRAPYPRPYSNDPELWSNWQFHEMVHLAAAFERSSEFDVIHTHTYQWVPPLAATVDTPSLHTEHLPTDRDVLAAYRRFPTTRIVAVSRHQRRRLSGIDDVTVVPNAVDVEAFPFGPAGGDHLLFLGHLIERKGPLEAIEVARRAGMRLVMAGKGHDDYFRSHVEPLIDGVRVQHLGPVDIASRNRLLAGAAALVFTSRRAEPFGLVMPEAMACGTPVVALGRCAVPEIVEQGVTGYHAETVEELAELVPAALALDRRRVRAAVARRFDRDQMAGGYEAIYRRLVAERTGAPALASTEASRLGSRGAA